MVLLRTWTTNAHVLTINGRTFLSAGLQRERAQTRGVLGARTWRQKLRVGGGHSGGVQLSTSLGNTRACAPRARSQRRNNCIVYTSRNNTHTHTHAAAAVSALEPRGIPREETLNTHRHTRAHTVHTIDTHTDFDEHADFDGSPL